MMQSGSHKNTKGKVAKQPWNPSKLAHLFQEGLNQKSIASLHKGNAELARNFLSFLKFCAEDSRFGDCVRDASHAGSCYARYWADFVDSKDWKEQLTQCCSLPYEGYAEFFRRAVDSKSSSNWNEYCLSTFRDSFTPSQLDKFFKHFADAFHGNTYATQSLINDITGFGESAAKSKNKKTATPVARKKVAAKGKNISSKSKTAKASGSKSIAKTKTAKVSGSKSIAKTKTAKVSGSKSIAKTKIVKTSGDKVNLGINKKTPDGPLIG